MFTTLCVESHTNIQKVNSRVMIDAKTFVTARPSHKPNFIFASKTIDTEKEEYLKLSDDEVLICDKLIPGFALADKRWCLFDVSLIKEVDFNEGAFQSLLLPQDQKEMIHSLVKIHSDERIQFDDVIKGKGKGMVFLLHGVPGVGKTLTAGKRQSIPMIPPLLTKIGTHQRVLQTSLNGRCTR